MYMFLITSLHEVTYVTKFSWKGIQYTCRRVKESSWNRGRGSNLTLTVSQDKVLKKDFAPPPIRGRYILENVELNYGIAPF